MSRSYWARSSHIVDTNGNDKGGLLVVSRRYLVTSAEGARALCAVGQIERRVIEFGRQPLPVAPSR